MSFLMDFPYILPLNRNLTEFDGFLTVKDRDIRVRISISDDKNVEIRGNWSDTQMLNSQEGFTHKKTVSSLSDLSALLHELQTIWEKTLIENKDDDTLLIGPSFYASVASQISEIRAESVEEISDDLKELKLVVLDRTARKHFLNVHFPDKFPDDKMGVSFSLPSNFVLEKSFTLSTLIEKFEKELECYQLFWDCVDKIDDNYCVLEPQTSTRKDCLRKIAISNKVSLTIIVDPKKPNNVPEFTFAGPDEEIIALDNLLSTKLHLWDNTVFPMTNFANILEIEFPGKKSETHEELLEPCAICYSYLLEEAIPTESCACKQRFHTKCLIEWLSSIPNARHTFNCYKGVCPYCGQEITIQEK